jgi:hypothetical protein
MAKGLVWAMEELAEQEAAAAAEASNTGFNDTLEEDAPAAAEAADQVTDTVAAIEEAEEDLDTLEDIASVMDESSENGGMDQTAARVAEVAVESIYKRLGVRSKSAMPSMESFGSTKTRVTATKIAVEEIKEKATAIWDAIVKAFQTLKQWIINFFKRLFDANEALKQRAAALQKMASTMSGTPSKEKEVDLGGLANKLTMGGSVSPEGVKKGIENIIANVNEVAETIKSGISTGLASKEFEQYVLSKEKFDAYQSKTPGSVGSINVSKDDGYETIEGMKTSKFEETLGNKTIVTITPMSSLAGEAGFLAVSKLKTKVETFNKKQKALEKTTVPELGKNEVLAMINEVLNLTKAVDSSKASIKALEVSIDATVKDMKSLASNNKAVEGSGQRAKVIGKCLNGTVKYISGMAVNANSIAVAAGTAALGYAEKSIKGAGAAKEAPGTAVAVAK